MGSGEDALPPEAGAGSALVGSPTLTFPPISEAVWTVSVTTHPNLSTFRVGRFLRENRSSGVLVQFATTFLKAYHYPRISWLVH